MKNNDYKKKKPKKRFQKRLVKGTKIFLKKEKAKRTNMLLTYIEILLKKNKKRSVNMVMNNIKIFWRMIIENIFLECKK